MLDCYKFLKKADTYYLATVEDGMPRVRPFGTVNIFEGKLYVQTGKDKSVFQQLMANPNAEICGCYKGTWVRVSGKLVDDNRLRPRSPCWTLTPTCVAVTMRTMTTPVFCTSRTLLPPSTTSITVSVRSSTSKKDTQDRISDPVYFFIHFS